MLVGQISAPTLRWFLFLPIVFLRCLLFGNRARNWQAEAFLQPVITWLTLIVYRVSTVYWTESTLSEWELNCRLFGDRWGNGFQVSNLLKFSDLWIFHREISFSCFPSDPCGAYGQGIVICKPLQTVEWRAAKRTDSLAWAFYSHSSEPEPKSHGLTEILMVSFDPRFSACISLTMSRSCAFRL